MQIKKFQYTPNCKRWRERFDGFITRNLAKQSQAIITRAVCAFPLDTHVEQQVTGSEMSAEKQILAAVQGNRGESICPCVPWMLFGDAIFLKFLYV